MSTNLGVYLTVLAGKGVPTPLPATMTELLQQVEISERTDGPSGFQIVFGASRGDPPDLKDYPLVTASRFRPFSRVVILATVSTAVHVLMDGFVTCQDLDPAAGGAGATFTVTGEDVSVLMDLKARIVSHPGLGEMSIAMKLIGSAAYARLGLLPEVVRPPILDPPPPTVMVPVQHGTDRQYLRELAARFGYVFYVRPGKAPLSNIAYWGPPKRSSGAADPALSVAMNAATNVERLRFSLDALAPATVSGRVQDGRNNRHRSVRVERSDMPALSRNPALRAQRPDVRQALVSGAEGLTFAQARALALGQVNRSVERVAAAEGELNVLAYGNVLRPGRLVGVRGAGHTYDGHYAVERVTHLLRPGEFRQRFTLVREGTGSRLPVVRP